MAELRGVPPGRAGRLWLQARLNAGRRAAHLLDDKLRLLRGEQARFRLLEERTGTRWRVAWQEADRWGLRAAFLAGGREFGLSAPTHRAEVTVSWDRLMGLRYPVEAACHVPAPSTSDRGPGSAALVEAAAAACHALSAAAEHAAAVTARRIIDAEVAATRRRLRAITHRWLPQLEDALRRLTHDLDETEQAETFRLRWAVAAHERRSGR